MTPEEAIRWTVLAILAGSLVIGVVGGLVTPVSGMWRDGDRLILLKQVAWLVRGTCVREGGHEVYRGTAVFGRVRLKRTAFGLPLLKSMGFAPEFLPLLGGEPLARFDFKLSGAELDGTFEGRKFTFSKTPLAIRAVLRLPKEVRVWKRSP